MRFIRQFFGLAGGLMAALFAVAPASFAVGVLTQNFDNVAAIGAAGWAITNNSIPAGTTSWFQGNPAVFPSQSGAPNSYIAANFLAAGSGGNISDWLLLPALPLTNGDLLTFYTRSDGFAPDRLEVRLSMSGSSADVGTTDTSVGAFTTLLMTVNPALSISGYPTVWTQFTTTVSGLPGVVNGRLGFRYLVPDTTVNADYIGIDTVTLRAEAIPEPGTMLLFSAAVASLAAGRLARRPWLSAFF